jgi:hypothetical protein
LFVKSDLSVCLQRRKQEQKRTITAKHKVVVDVAAGET